MNRRGVSLLELTLALALTAVLAGAGLASFGSLRRSALAYAARTLAADLNMARQTAMLLGRNCYINLFRDHAGGWYYVYLTDESNLEAERIKEVRMTGGVEFYTFGDGSGYRNFHYLPRGTVSDSFTVHLRNGSLRQRVTIRPDTGLATVQP